jgi:hypothetical protein
VSRRAILWAAIALFIAAAVFGWASGAWGHEHWISAKKFRNPLTGELCCGDNDCFMIPKEQVRLTKQGYELSTGELVPYSEALPSEDGEYWRCKRYNGSRRCFFAPPLGS